MKTKNEMVAEEHQKKLKDIRENPDRHRHADLNELVRCCMVNGAIDLSIMDAHEGLQGQNGGRGCDVKQGPCSCGGWH